MIGRTLAHFEITAKLGEGGMGVVWRARDTKLGREVAIKVLPDAVAGDPTRLARFEREAQLLASLNHPNIAGIHQVAEDGELHFLVMELANGRTLAELIQAGPLPVSDALEIARQIAEALEEAHERGIVHRDLKPGNVMVTDDDRVKVLDFGLAKAWAPEDSGDRTGGDPSSSATLPQGLTQHGSILGTPAYMSPEQSRGKPVDRRTDIWAFGCVLYEMLTGEKAFHGPTASDTMVAVLEREPSYESLPSETPRRVVELIERCLRKEARTRLRDIGEARVQIGEAQAPGTAPQTGSGAPGSGSWPPGEGHSAARRSSRWRGRRALLFAGLAAALLATAFLLGESISQILPGDRIVYLIDTSAPLGVYDDETRTLGGTNADNLTDLLGDLPVTLVKETTSPFWRREHQVLQQKPALIIIHLSAFSHQPAIETFEELEGARSELTRAGLEDPLELGRTRLIAFLGYIALGSPGTRFIVYSRGTFSDETDAKAWLADVETRFPELAGRLVTFDVVRGPWGASFQHAETGAAMRRLVESTLGLD